jgi:hypothetical protein
MGDAMTRSDGIDGVLRALANREPWDILVPGLLDTDRGHPQFRPHPTSVYIVLESGYVRCDGVRASGQLQMRIVDKIEVPNELRNSDDEFAVGSFALPFFCDPPSPFQATGVTYVESEQSQPQNGIVTCAEFAFNEHWKLFIDPLWPFGIRLGADGAYKRWKADYFEPSRMTEISLSASEVLA